MKVLDVVYPYGADRDRLESETADFQHVLGIDFGGGYEWDSLEAWYSPSRRKFFWLEGSGCSCNSLGDGVSSIDDFSFGNREELVSAVRAKYDGAYFHESGMASSLLADIAAVKTFRPIT